MENLDKESWKKIFNEIFIPGLMDFVRIPNLTRNSDIDFFSNGLIQKANHYAIEWANALKIPGLILEYHEDTDKTPFIFGELAPSENYSKTIIFYGHLDKQPHLPGWIPGTNNIEPAIIEGKLYGRGSVDDGYAFFGVISLCKFLADFNINHPRIVLLVESDEESNSKDMMYYFDKFKKRIGNADVCIALDSGTVDYNSFTCITNLRGIISLTLDVQVSEKGFHSGDASGCVPSTFMILRSLLDRIEDSKTGMFKEEFQPNIPLLKYQEILNIVKNHPKYLERFNLLQGVQYCSQDLIKLYIKNTWTPQLEVVGMDGFPSIAASGNVLRPRTTAKLSIRIPSLSCPKNFANKIKEILEENPPFNSKVSVTIDSASPGWCSSEFDKNFLDILNDSAKKGFGTDIAFLHRGASIPFIDVLNKIMPNTAFIVTGVAGPGSNSHVANENLHLDCCMKLLYSIGHLLNKLK